MKTILSLCDKDGVWAEPYVKAGYRAVLVDGANEPGGYGNVAKLRMTPQELLECDLSELNIVGITAVPPWQALARAGSPHWKKKDSSGETAETVATVTACLQAIENIQPQWWALLAPLGRLHLLVPQLGPPWYFSPQWYGQPYGASLCLWGRFNKQLPRTETVRKPGKCRTKMVTSEFASAFYLANR